MASTKRYTKSETAFIQAAILQGAPLKAIAAFFGVQPSAMTAFVQRHNLKRHTLSPIDLDTLATKYDLISHARSRELIRQFLKETPQP